MKKIIVLLGAFVSFISFCSAWIICIDDESESYVDCPVACETWENRSALYINDIQHLSAWIINVTIPEEISWDYTGNDEQFDLVVSGYAVDSDYIQSIIDINSFHPSNEDFTDVFVSGLTLILPYIVITLFIVLIRRLLKRIFK